MWAAFTANPDLPPNSISATMAWDSKSARRRQNSTATKQPVHTQNKSITSVVIEPKSAHVADPSLQPFLNPSFDSADYLNATLPSLQTDRKSTRLNSSHLARSRMPSSA